MQKNLRNLLQPQNRLRTLNPSPLRSRRRNPPPNRPTKSRSGSNIFTAAVSRRIASVACIM